MRYWGEGMGHQVQRFIRDFWYRVFVWTSTRAVNERFTPTSRKCVRLHDKLRRLNSLAVHRTAIESCCTMSQHSELTTMAAHGVVVYPVTYFGNLSIPDKEEYPVITCH